MKKQFLYIANFKSYLTFNEEIKWCKDNIQELELLVQNDKIVLCPSFVSLNLMNEYLHNSEINLGAQNCSSFAPGAYTGEITAQSLSQLNMNYCIIGHNERRQYFNENNSMIAKKIELLHKNNIIPILCIGETQQEYCNDKTEEVLKHQLEVLDSNIVQEIIIAYEPVWAIGTGIIPDIEYLNQICDLINKLMDNKYKILYGGSVNPDLSQKLKQFAKIDGFLIGKASTSFQEFKKIVLS